MTKLQSFLYNLLFVDQKNQLLSHTKMWSNVGLCSMVFAFVHATLNQSPAVDLWIAFGAIVIGNHTATSLLRSKAGVPDNKESDDATK